jgi:D-sedoheptulose 7-phosphate isomerase
MAQTRHIDVGQLGWLVTPRSSYQDAIADRLADRQALFNRALAHLTNPTIRLAEVIALLVETLRSGHKVLAAGNGGSAAEAQHFVAELVGRFKRERAPYPAVALTTDSAVVTGVANDYGYEEVFARQVFAFGQPGDLLIAYSTSGESENLLRAAAAAHQCEMVVVAITGESPNRLERQADLVLPMPALETDAVQELHLVVTHLLCDLAESALCTEDVGR